ncbi:MAG TPA: heparan-alpha-glucosaminide N-acetyltransferase domain-containing protein [Mucilaginibacter sp.]|nr:heparan-alpha-glucosaminide N-acetyltransferase domain-containing protein [Mucilaginibacter sp.]
MTEGSAPTPKYRIESIDILRGAVMLIMAIDHVRDFFHHGHPEPNDLTITTPILFFTRFITHFCAPTFVLLTGVSAYLAGTRRTENQLSLFLIKRGLWLIIIELIVITFAITLNPFFPVFILQVIWAIGGSMILLGILVGLRASWRVIGVIGLVIFLGHNIFDVIKVHAIADTFLGRLLLTTTRGPASYWSLGNGHGLAMAYALLPWTGVMLIGYAFGSLYKKTFDVVERRKILLYSGLFLIAFFLVFRYFNIYGDPSPWSVQKTTVLSIISFFNVTKYPCSLLFLSITLGPALIILSVTEKISNKLTAILIVYGNVPFFYYVCHWYLIKALNIIVFYISGFNNNQVVNPHMRKYFQPDDFGFNLFGVYVVWLVVIILLYLPCRWYSKYKGAHHQWWLSYL